MSSSPLTTEDQAGTVGKSSIIVAPQSLSFPTDQSSMQRRRKQTLMRRMQEESISMDAHVES